MGSQTRTRGRLLTVAKLKYMRFDSSPLRHPVCLRRAVPGRARESATFRSAPPNKLDRRMACQASSAKDEAVFSKGL